MSRKRTVIKRGEKTIATLNRDGTITLSKRVQKRTLRKAVAKIGIEKLVENGWNPEQIKKAMNIINITYTYRGRVERGNGKPGWDSHPAYSETTPDGQEIVPWMTRAECMADAKARGATAQFYRGRTAALFNLGHG